MWLIKLSPVFVVLILTQVGLMQAVAQTAYDLKNQFNEDETIYLQLDVEMRGASVAGENQQPIQAERETLMSMNTVETSEDGARILVNLERMLMTFPSMNRREPMDVRETLMQGADVTFEVQIDATGDVVADGGSEAMSGSGIQGVNQSPMEHFPYIRLPEGPVRINQSWNHSWEVPYEKPSKPVIAWATYTLRDVREVEGVQMAFIETETSIAVDDVSFGQSVQAGSAQLNMAYNHYRMTSTGEIRFDVTTGRMHSFDDDKRIEMDMDSSALLAGAEFPSTMKLILRQITEGTCSLTEPESIFTLEPMDTP